MDITSIRSAQGAIGQEGISLSTSEMKKILDKVSKLPDIHKILDKHPDITLHIYKDGRITYKSKNVTNAQETEITKNAAVYKVLEGVLPKVFKKAEHFGKLEKTSTLVQATALKAHAVAMPAIEQVGNVVLQKINSKEAGQASLKGREISKHCANINMLSVVRRIFQLAFAVFGSLVVGSPFALVYTLGEILFFAGYTFCDTEASIQDFQALKEAIKTGDAGKIFQAFMNFFSNFSDAVSWIFLIVFAVVTILGITVPVIWTIASVLVVLCAIVPGLVKDIINYNAQSSFITKLKDYQVNATSDNKVDPAPIRNLFRDHLFLTKEEEEKIVEDNPGKGKNEIAELIHNATQAKWNAFKLMTGVTVDQKLIDFVTLEDFKNSDNVINEVLQSAKNAKASTVKSIIRGSLQTLAVGGGLLLPAFCDLFKLLPKDVLAKVNHVVDIVYPIVMGGTTAWALWDDKKTVNESFSDMGKAFAGNNTVGE